MATGRKPNLPLYEKSSRVAHSSNFLTFVSSLKHEIMSESKFSFLVIGGGQSAGEIVNYIYKEYKKVEVHWCFRKNILKGVDSSPFTNKEYHIDSVRRYYELNQESKFRYLEELSASNYSTVDNDILSSLFADLYYEKMHGESRLFMHSNFDYKRLEGDKNIVTVYYKSCIDDKSYNIKANAVIFATGYKKESKHPLLEKCEQYINKSSVGNYVINSDYSVSNEMKFGIYMNGWAEHSHGPSDPTLSILPSRSKVILESIIRRLGYGN